MANPKAITIVNQYIGSPYHGMEYRHYYLAKNLQKMGYQVRLVSGSFSHLFSTPPAVEEAFVKEMIDGIEYIWVKVPKYDSSKSFKRIWNMLYFSWKLRFLKEISSSHIFVSSPSLFPVRVGFKWAKKFQTKLLFEVRDIWPLTLVELSGLKDTHPLIRFMTYFERFGYKNADRVISLLPNAKEHFMLHGMAEEKFVYLPNGIEFTQSTASLSKEVEMQIPKDKFIIAYTGTVGIANNLDYLLDGAKRLLEKKDIHFIILGNGGEKERLVKRAQKEQLVNVTFIDAISKEYIQPFLTKIDVAFISLLPEPLFRFGVSPNKVFEYMYAKKPIIWAIEAGNNLVEDARCGVSVSLQDSQSLEDAVIKLKNMDKRALRNLGKSGYNFVLKNHSYQMLAEKLIKIIEE